MEVGSVSSSVNAAYAATAQARQAQAPQQALPPDQPVRNQPVDENEAASRARSENEGNRPTVNTSGQVVGTMVNTTA
jgi:hypothetical protein